MKRALPLGLVLFLVTGCGRNSKPGTLFTLLPPSTTGIHFANNLHETVQENIIEYLYFYNGGGVAAGDINNDGLVDLYFSSNQNENKLYLNKGNFEFEDITEKSGAAGHGNWKTGVTMADVNGDGLLDIYVCGVSKYKTFQSPNQLLINNGDLTFTDRTREAGLWFEGLSTQAVFFDYDLDGDLDCFLLNHSVHTTRTIGDVSSRNTIDSLSGDRLFRNDLIRDGNRAATAIFTDVTTESGILQSRLGYGLGVVASDLNLDGYPDLYVSNDFNENDYLYLNRPGGKFRQVLEKSMGHCSRFSMGCDAADINNDGLPDLMTLDMMPRNEDIIKTSAGDDSYEVYRFKLSNGFHYQVARNCLQLNRAVSDSSVYFSDIAIQAGVEATDWSWSPLLADFDNDGFKDLFVSNGILRRPNDMDYISFIADENVQRNLETMEAEDMKLLDQMPAGKVSNFAFRNTGQLSFDDVTLAWGLSRASFSNGACYADLDNDGDVDLVTNNINEAAYIYRNEQRENRYLKVSFKGPDGNSFGIGARVKAYVNGKQLSYENAGTRSFCSSVPPSLTMGMGSAKILDSMVVYWPGGKVNVLSNIETDKTIVVDQAAGIRRGNTNIKEVPLFSTTTPGVLGQHRHRENNFNAFRAENLMPQMLTTEGPPLAVADVDGNGLDDVFIGGGRGQSAELFTQFEHDRFEKLVNQPWRSDTLADVVDAAFFDADGDHDPDLLIVYGGQEIASQREALQPKLYLNESGKFRRSKGMPPIYSNMSCARPFDVDGDGDIDVFLGVSAMPLLYGMSPTSYLLLNDGHGNFTPKPDWLAGATFENMPRNRPGMVKDAVWTDLNRDHLPDLILVGEWMPITVLIQEPGLRFSNQTAKYGLMNSSGWWNVIKCADLDGDGDGDFVVGNLGLNSRLKATPSEPLQMLLGDFDGNGNSDQILVYYNQGKSYPFASRDQLVRQLPFLKKKFLAYRDYRNVSVRDIISDAQQGQFTRLNIRELRTSWIRNEGDSLRMMPLPAEAQFAPVEAIETGDFNNDGLTDLLLGGNLSAVQTELGPYDASVGLVLLGGRDGFRSLSVMQSGILLQGEVRDFRKINSSDGRATIVVSRNNSTPLALRAKQTK